MLLAEQEINTEQKWGRHAHYALALLFLISVVSIVDRYILAILLEPIKEDLQVSDTAMGFLAGLAFAIFNAVAAIPLARLSDRYSRRIIIVVGLAAWSVLTAMQGFAKSFTALALARIGVGIGEAATAPAAHSLISDFYPRAQRATAIAIFNTGGHVGVVVGLAGGGLLYEWLGWRMAMVAVGLPGLFLALLTWRTMKEPIRGSDGLRYPKMVEATGDASESMFAALTTLCKKHSFKHLLFTLPFFVVTNYVINIWGAVFLIRVHGMSVGQVGVTLGLTVGISGVVGNLLGGYLCDRKGLEDLRWYLWLPAIAALLTIPMYLGFVFSSNSTTALMFLAFAVFLISSHISPIYAIVQTVSDPDKRATASATVHVMSAILAAGLGPFLIGVLNDALTPVYGSQAIRYSLCAVVPCILFGVYQAFRAAFYIRSEIPSGGH